MFHAYLFDSMSQAIFQLVFLRKHSNGPKGEYSERMKLPTNQIIYAKQNISFDSGFIDVSGDLQHTTVPLIEFIQLMIYDKIVDRITQRHAWTIHPIFTPISFQQTHSDVREENKLQTFIKNGNYAIITNRWRCKSAHALE